MGPSELTTSDPARPEVRLWPRSPYKGLGYYGPEDRPLFTGRERDVKHCASVLVRRSNRVLLLHGRTGSGKSSFLRAGLIPCLESIPYGFEFLKADGRSGAKALFIRSTAAPLSQLAEAVFDFAGATHDFPTPDGPLPLPLAEALPPGLDRARFCELVNKDPRELMRTLKKLASRHPKTLVFVLDQAEEVLTLTAGDAGEKAKAGLFDFINHFAQTDSEVRLIITLRTEFYGQFDDELRRRSRHAHSSAMDSYLLPELGEKDLIRAIELPTLRQDVNRYGIPFDQYHFSFEDGLPRTIVQDIQKAAPQGGPLPVLQIVCETLFRVTKEKASGQQPWVITGADYLGLGGIEGQVARHLDEVLGRWCILQGIPGAESSSEVDRWKECLFQLVKSQPDGTVTTRLKTEDELQEKARQLGCRADAPSTLQHLAEENYRILRRTDLLNLDTRKTLPGYSLGHDALGLALTKWKANSAAASLLAAEMSRARLMLRILGGFYLLGGAMFCVLALMVEGATTIWPRAVLVLFGLCSAFAGIFWFMAPEKLVKNVHHIERSFRAILRRGQEDFRDILRRFRN
jgi:hypothetical protein